MSIVLIVGEPGSACSLGDKYSVRSARIGAARSNIGRK
nr:hypothetical protein [Kibdelosporangium sp. MJ126-NF4]CTQ98149.1 hypothetical protein [Kibdelosporangium sp. MJ126-NF4]